MDLKTLLAQPYSSSHQYDDQGTLLTIKDTHQYRWFEYGGSSIQSLMNKTNPEQIMMPVCQSLLLFLLFDNESNTTYINTTSINTTSINTTTGNTTTGNTTTGNTTASNTTTISKKPTRLLNLGIGGASIERALSVIPDLVLTSVDASQVVIDMALKHFHLPQQGHIVCQQAEQFIEQTQTLYDVVLCDLFIGEKSPECLFTEHFHQQLSTITQPTAIVMINLKVENEAQLLQALLMLKKYFVNIALIEFDDFMNIVIIGSKHEIPVQAILQERVKHFKLIDLTCLDKVIDKVRYIGHN